MDDALEVVVWIRIRNGRGAGQIVIVSGLYDSYRLKQW